MSEKAQCDVVVIGSSNMDMVVRCPELPLPGQTLLGSDFVMNPGGKGANQAYAAAKMGAKTQLVARIGNDMFAESFHRSYDEVGLGTDFVVRDENCASGVALIYVDDNGENSIVVVPGANGNLSPADVDAAKEVIQSAKVMILQLEIPMETVVHAAQMAIENQTLVILNPAPARPLPDALLEKVDLLVANETEIQVLTGVEEVGMHTAATACRPLLEKGVTHVITTLGRRGALVTASSSGARVPGFAVKAVDTTSAGDTFTGALACAMAEGKNVEDAVLFANAAAALAATKPGAQISMPTRAEVDAMLQDGETT